MSPSRYKINLKLIKTLFKIFFKKGVLVCIKFNFTLSGCHKLFAQTKFSGSKALWQKQNKTRES